MIVTNHTPFKDSNFQIGIKSYKCGVISEIDLDNCELNEEIIINMTHGVQGKLKFNNQNHIKQLDKRRFNGLMKDYAWNIDVTLGQKI